ncbi:hypothetical protein ACOME3_008574 [Neoechinorhynchus agilis]
MFNRTRTSGLKVTKSGRKEPGNRQTAITKEFIGTRDYSERSVYRYEPVVLHVSNLDYKMSREEWSLYFHKCFSQIASIIKIELRDSNPMNSNERTYRTKSLNGFITVAHESDAMQIISRFHNKKVGYRRLQIHILARNVERNGRQSNVIDLELLKDRISFLLSGHDQMTLTDLNNIYRQHFTDYNITSTELLKIPRVVDVISSTNRGISVRLRDTWGSDSDAKVSNIEPSDWQPLQLRVTCDNCRSATVYSPMEATVKVESPSLSTFSGNVRRLLEQHGGSVDLSRFVSCYNALFKPLITNASSGICLEHYISCVEGVTIMSDSTNTPQCGEKCGSGFSTLSPDYQIIKRVSLYEVSNRQSNNKPLCTIIQSKTTLEREILKILENETHCVIPACTFLNAYHRRFHRQLRVADYGCRKISELFQSLPAYLQVIGSFNDQYLTLPHTVQMQRFQLSLRRIFRSTNKESINLETLLDYWTLLIGKAFDPYDFGVTSILDLLYCLRSSKEFKIVTTSVSSTIFRFVKSKQCLNLTNDILNIMIDKGGLQIRCYDLLNELANRLGKRFADFTDLEYDFDLLLDYVDCSLIQLSECLATMEQQVTVSQTGLKLVLGAKLVKLVSRGGRNSTNISDLKHLWFSEEIDALDINAYGFIDFSDMLIHMKEYVSVLGNGYVEICPRRIRCILLSTIIDLLDTQLNYEDQIELDIYEFQSRVKNQFNVQVRLCDIASCLGDELVSIKISSFKSIDTVRISGTKCLMFAKAILSIFYERYDMIRLNNYPPGYSKPTSELCLDEIMHIYERKFGLPLDPINYGCYSYPSLLSRMPDIISFRHLVTNGGSDLTLISLSLAFQSLYYHWVNSVKVGNASQLIRNKIEQCSPLNKFVDN